MPLVLVRVDCRLIHGQVVETWLPHTGANCLLVANDDLAGNTCLRTVMELAVPPSIHVMFCRLGDVASSLAEIDRAGEKAILLCATFEDALRIHRTGVRFPALNVGNLHYATGKVEISPSVFFSPEDFDAVHCFCHSGIAVNVRATPFDAGTSYEPERK
ncbi:MAG: PTS sugar transporter subunit IIB [Deltaproteobacteria bacterium]|nr:PTS sugar transporter subunit IIB [Deltaproteobacteria bacterium]PWB62178.1 MAG: PTS mannose/fructose/sorbose transporter subunit IIB [Deltaproteobacteria bacterium]